MSGCRWVASGLPRMLRTHLRDCEAAGCEGCQPCEDRHCGLCGIKHVDSLTCPTCIGHVRDDLKVILAMCGRTLTEAVHRGVNSEAAMLAGPTANVEAWRNRWMSARQGRISSDWLEDCRDELHPLWVLGTWDMLITEHLSHDSRTQAITVASAAQYLGANLTDLAQDADFAFEELAKEVSSCRSHMEDVLQDGQREDKGAPCPMCGKAALVKVTNERQAERCECGPWPTMKHADHARCSCTFTIRVEQLDPEQDPVTVRVYDEWPEIGHVHPRPDLDCIACRREADWERSHLEHVEPDRIGDQWVCPKRECKATYTEHDYREKVEAVYVRHADRLTASQIHSTYRVPEGTVRQWAFRDKVRKHGLDEQGRQLYDVADVLACRDGVAS